MEFTAQKFPFIEGLKNEKEGAVRLVFGTPHPETVVVVKYFDPVQKEKATVKWFIGSYEATKSHWKTTTPIDPAEAAGLEPDARRTVERAMAAMS